MIPVDGHEVEVNKYSIQNNGTRMLMFYWYQSKSRIVANEYLGKVLLARDTLLTGRSGGSIVRVIVPDTEGADREGIAFVSKLIPDVQRCFGSVPLQQTRLNP
jgi:EpsI family protein